MISFDEFWKQYPRRVGRKLAERKWMRMTGFEQKCAIESLALWKQTVQWNRDGGMFIPYGSTFLSQERWKDEPWSGAFGGQRHTKTGEASAREKGLF